MQLLTFILRFRYLFLKLSGGASFPPPLSQKEEEEYFSLARAGDGAAREKLIEHNLRLVAHIVKKYYAGQENQEDLMSVGSIGLIKAVDTFKTDAGARFATYSAKCIQNEILMYFRTKKKTGMEVSMHETIDVDKDGNPLTYLDVISTEDTIADDLALRVESETVRRLIRSQLDPREQKILIRRYGLDNRPRATQREIAQRLGISRSYVSRIEKCALEKIRVAMTHNPAKEDIECNKNAALEGKDA